MTEAVLKDLADNGLDAMNIDIKGDKEMVKKYCGIDVEVVWRNAKLAKDLGIHIEITTLLIENLNSSENTVNKIANRIVEELGKNVPYHISRFYPQYKSSDYGINVPTKLRLLYNAYNTAKAVGLEYVYLGNVTNKKYSRTVCPKCSEIVIERNDVFGVEKLNIDQSGKCNSCGFNILKL